jgi:hypothetical protein
MMNSRDIYIYIYIPAIHHLEQWTGGASPEPAMRHHPEPRADQSTDRTRDSRTLQ